MCAPKIQQTLLFLPSTFQVLLNPQKGTRSHCELLKQTFWKQQGETERRREREGAGGAIRKGPGKHAHLNRKHSQEEEEEGDRTLRLPPV